MDNFEYSIQINDRDWEEFYSTAEECGLIQASLAKEEELWLSDTEQEDTANSMPSTKHKFIRISLCPPPPEKYPALQISQPVVHHSVQTSNRWQGPNEDILSGSEDEEEFGSVTRFLCQKEYMLQKETEERIDIPLPSPVCPSKISNLPHSVEKGLDEYIRTLNFDGNAQWEVDHCQKMGETKMERSFNTQEELEHCEVGSAALIQPDSNPRPSADLCHPNTSYCAHKVEHCSSVNENIPDVNTSQDDPIGKIGHLREAALSGNLSKDDSVSAKHRIFDGPPSPEQPPPSKDNELVYYTMENNALDNNCEDTIEARVNSSAVEQNVLPSTIEELDSCNSQSDSLNIDMKVSSNTSNFVDPTSSTHSLVPVNITTRAWREQVPLSHQSSAFNRKTVLTLPEMYDFFFDDVSDTVLLETESSMESNEGIVYTPEIDDMKTTSNTHSVVDPTTFTHRLEPVNISTRAWGNQTPLSHPSSASYRKTVLSLPEMYDFFFDDVSDTVSLETESNIEGKKRIMFTPEMYDVKATSNTYSSVGPTIFTHSLAPVNVSTRAWRNQTPLSHQSSASYRKTTGLSLPEMYDFFFDDVSDTVLLEAESSMEGKKEIVYTPEMYEYFFLEDEKENRAKSKGGNTSQESSTDLALVSASSVAATWPEACEFFFADGPQDQNREGILFSVPSSQVQSAADVIQSFVPKGLKGFTVRRAHRGPYGSLIPQDLYGAPEEPTSGAIAPYLSPNRTDACLVFLAFASWAVKSSDLQSSDGWKTALLANIGAVSAIQYLRRRSRRTWQESPPQSGDET